MKEQEVPQEFAERYLSKLSQLYLFKGLKEKNLRQLLQAMTQVSVAGGEVLIREGDEDYSMYILIYGRLQVTKGHQSPFDPPLAEICPGEIVGEIALLTEQTRTATVTAIRDSILLKLTEENYLAFEEAHIRSSFKMAKTSLIRLTQKQKIIRPGQNAKLITIAPAGDSNHRPFAQMLCQQLNQSASAMLIDFKTCDEHCEGNVAHCEPGSETDRVILRWIQSLEDSQQYIIFVTDRQMTPWSARCLREADRNFFVADPSVHPAMNSIELQYFNEGTSLLKTSDLVFLHPPGTEKITGSKEWLIDRPVGSYHHCLMNSEEHLERLVRLVTDSAIGLVLNGGGARGYSHIGVYRALREHNIPIDFIGGTSMGAVVAAAILTHSVEEVIALSKDFGEHYRNDLTLPYIALTKGKRLTDYFQQWYGDSNIEDLWTKFFCVSCNLSKGKLKIHDGGELWKAVRMSASIPAVFPPVYVDGDMYVDGGIMNNMPTNIMRDSMRGGKIIAVNCSADAETLPARTYDTAYTSGWQLLVNSLFDADPNGLHYDTLSKIILASVNLGSSEHQDIACREADYLIEVETRQYGLLEFSKAEEIEQLGYETAIEALKKLDL